MDPTPSSLWRVAGEAGILLFRGAENLEARLTRDGWMAVSGVPLADFNYVMVGDGQRPEEWLRESVELLRAKGLPFSALFAAEVADRLAATAEALGLQRVGPMPLMIYRPAGPLPRAVGYDLERVESDAALQDAYCLMAATLGSGTDPINQAHGPRLRDAPGTSVFLARRRGEPISTATTVRAGPIVSIWNVVTPPEHQRQGAGHAVVTHAIDHHRQRGAETFVLLSSEAGMPLYSRIGFTTLTEAAVWVMR